jgi:hypothetical protein
MPEPVPDALLAEHPWIATARPVDYCRLQIGLPLGELGEFLPWDDNWIVPVGGGVSHIYVPPDYYQGWSSTTAALALPFYDQVQDEFVRQCERDSRRRTSLLRTGFESLVYLSGDDWGMSLAWYEGWQDTLEFLHALASGEEGEVYSNIEQAWALAVVRTPHGFAFREYDHDGSQYDTRVLIERDALLAQVAPLRRQTAELLSRLQHCLNTHPERVSKRRTQTKDPIAMMDSYTWPEGT